MSGPAKVGVRGMQLHTQFFDGANKNSCVPWCQLEALYHPATVFAGKAVIRTGLQLLLRKDSAAKKTLKDITVKGTC